MATGLSKKLNASCASVFKVDALSASVGVGTRCSIIEWCNLSTTGECMSDWLKSISCIETLLGLKLLFFDFLALPSRERLVVRIRKR